MSNVIEFNGITRLPIPPERILNRAIKDDLEDVIVIGWDKEENFYFAGSMSSGPEALWLLELAKTRLLQAGNVLPGDYED